jgi:DnaJ-class molecular chaperone
MPILNNDPLGPIKKNYHRGNLIIKFDIEFPKQMTEELRQQVTAILNEDELLQI